MRWDRKLGILAVVMLIIAAAAAAVVVWWIANGSQDSGERIRGRAEDGFAELMERVSDLDNVGHVMISQRGKYASQQKYKDFDEAWFGELEMTGHEFLEENISYTHAVKFRLRTYDYENVYLPEDTREVYGRYTDEVVLFRNGDIYYAIYVSGSREYRFIASCPPVTQFLEEVDG